MAADGRAAGGGSVLCPPSAMGSDGQTGPRPGSTVISIILPDRAGHQAGSEKKGHSPGLSPGQLKMIREGDNSCWTERERRPTSARITVDQLSITGMALVFNPGETHTVGDKL